MATFAAVLTAVSVISLAVRPGDDGVSVGPERTGEEQVSGLEPGVTGNEASPAEGTAPGQTPRGRSAGSRTSGRASTSGQGAAPAVSGPGGTIKVGVLIDGGDQCAAFGEECTSNTASVMKWIDAIVKDVNKNGGFGGRQASVVVREVDQSAQGTTVQTRLQNEACVGLTEDDKVFMVISVGTGLTLNATQCYVDHKTPVWEYWAIFDEVSWAELKQWYAPAYALNLSRLARTWPGLMKEQNFLTDKMGLIGYDAPRHRRPAENILIPGIEKAGGKIIDQQWMPGEYDGIASGSSAALLRFSQKTIDRVVMWATGAGATLIFTNQAYQAGYRPRYAFSTWNSPALAATVGSAAGTQFDNSLGIGWHAATDLSALPPPTAREKACWAVVNAGAGENFQDHGAGGPDASSLFCDAFWTAQAALAPAATRAISASEVSALYQGLGESYKPVQYAKSRFSPSQPDSLAVYSPFTYSNQCSCFNYLGGWREIPN